MASYISFDGASNKYPSRRSVVYGKNGMVCATQPLAVQAGIEIMKKGDILVLFDTLIPSAEVQPYLPSKIVEYLLLKKPILGICGDNSPSYRILKEYGFDTVGYEKDEIKKNIRRLIEDASVADYPLHRLNNSYYGKLLVDQK